MILSTRDYTLHGTVTVDPRRKEKGIDNPIHKQDMPFIAVTARNIYYAQYNQSIENPRIDEFSTEERSKFVNQYVSGVECYSRDDVCGIILTKKGETIGA